MNGRLIDVETGVDGAVYLLYKNGDEVFRTPIKLPTTAIKGTFTEVNDLFSKMNYNGIQKYIQLKGPTFSLDLEALCIKKTFHHDSCSVTVSH